MESRVVTTFATNHVAPLQFQFRNFTIQHKKPSKLRNVDAKKFRYVKSEGEGVYTPKHEKIFQLENGYYLLFYHRPEWWRISSLYLKFLIPMGICIYLIKKNPFYKTYPAMLPAMFIGLILTFISLVKYSKVSNMLVHQVHMDPTGTELSFIYKNAVFRRFRNDRPQTDMLISQLADPPQGDDYLPLAGDLFPTKYPIDKTD